jgi:plasmid stabilization system protein ParE
MPSPLAVVFQARATREVEAIDAWWRENRPSAPDLFATELGDMIAAVALLPSLGAPARNARLVGVRRVLLRRTRYHVYYWVHADQLEVLAVWHAVRGAGPGV